MNRWTIYTRREFLDLKRWNRFSRRVLVMILFGQPGSLFLLSFKEQVKSGIVKSKNHHIRSPKKKYQILKPKWQQNLSLGEFWTEMRKLNVNRQRFPTSSWGSSILHLSRRSTFLTRSWRSNILRLNGPTVNSRPRKLWIITSKSSGIWAND